MGYLFVGAATSTLSAMLSRPVAESDVLMFVIQKPVGSTGWLAWREMWILKDDGPSFIMTFSEDGAGGAFFEISQRQSFDFPLTWSAPGDNPLRRKGAF
ncbi:MAG: hypothetical protein AAF662_05905 [Pseudomonadota bacterium]